MKELAVVLVASTLCFSVQGKAPQPTKAFLFSSGGTVDKSDLNLTGRENWFGIYIKKDRIFIGPHAEYDEALKIKDLEGLYWGMGAHPLYKKFKTEEFRSRFSFFGIPDLSDGPKTGAIAVWSEEKCEKYGKRPNGAKICSLASKTAT